MTNYQRATFDIIRSLASGSISGTYAAVGGPFNLPARIICFTNNTDGDMFFSNDGISDQTFVPKNSFKLFDLTTNRLNQQQTFALQTDTQYYVRQSSAPSTGSVYIEIIGAGVLP